MSEERLRLYSVGLFSKWGFKDGDCPDIVLDYCDAHGLAYPEDWHGLLIQMVRSKLLPALKQQVTVEEIDTIHNPIRATTVNGRDVQDWWYDDQDHKGVLEPEFVEVDLSEFLRKPNPEETP